MIFQRPERLPDRTVLQGFLAPSPAALRFSSSGQIREERAGYSALDAFLTEPRIAQA
jgi:hypothetical protein